MLTKEEILLLISLLEEVKDKAIDFGGNVAWLPEEQALLDKIREM